MTETVVRVGDCRCPRQPHADGDWVELAPEPSIDIGAAVYAAVANVGDDPVLLQVELTRAYLRFGIRAWSFVDEKGEPVPITPRKASFDDVIRELLPFTNGGFDVADKADDLYSEAVLRPLMTRLSSMRSLGGQTVGSMSATRTTSRRRATPSEPSSPAATDGSPSADLDP
jgi:hypothetical protein